MGRRRLVALGFACASLLQGAWGCAREVRPEAAILVVVDTLRADRLLDPDAPRWRDAAMQRWLPRARIHERAFAASPWTLPSFASLYTGQIPSRHGAGEVLRREGGMDFTAIDTDGSPTLAERLSRAGFTTGAIVGNAALAPDFGVARGFDVYDYAPATNAQMRPANRVVDRALRFVDAHADEPFFLVVHLFDPHMDYDPPPGIRGRFTAGLSASVSLPVDGARKLARHPERVPADDRAFIAAAYDEEVAFVDRELARLLSRLEERGVLDRALVVLTSDHGEELFDHDGFEHGHALWQELVHVPLWFLGAGVEPGVTHASVSHVDLAPTLLDALGVAREGIVDGVSLWPALRDDAATPERPLFVEGTLYGPEQKAVVAWPYKLVWWPAQGRRELYDLSRDPDERQPLADVPEIAESLQALLQRATDQAARDRGAPITADLAPETLEALRELGYAD